MLLSRAWTLPLQPRLEDRFGTACACVRRLPQYSCNPHGHGCSSLEGVEKIRHGFVGGVRGYTCCGKQNWHRPRVSVTLVLARDGRGMVCTLPKRSDNHSGSPWLVSSPMHGRWRRWSPGLGVRLLWLSSTKWLLAIRMEGSARSRLLSRLHKQRPLLFLHWGCWRTVRGIRLRGGSWAPGEVASLGACEEAAGAGWKSGASPVERGSVECRTCCRRGCLGPKQWKRDLRS